MFISHIKLSEYECTLSFYFISMKYQSDLSQILVSFISDMLQTKKGGI